MVGTTKRLLAMLLATVLTFGTLAPMTVYANEETDDPAGEVAETQELLLVQENPSNALVQEETDDAEEDCNTLGHSWIDADCDAAKTCSVCSATEGEALGHSWADADCDTAKTCIVCGATEGEALGHSWEETENKKICTVCGAEIEIQQPEAAVLPVSQEELTVEDYATFLAELKVLEGYADAFAATNSKYTDAGLLVVNFIRTGVERYMSAYWSGLAGTEITAFTNYVQGQDAANGTTAMRLRNIVIENFTLPNGNPSDFGHMFGTLNILYYNSNWQSQDIAGWAGDICDLLLYSRDHGYVPEGTVDEMAAFILEKCFGVDADDAFGWDDFYGDMDAFYLANEWKGTGKKLSSLMESYFTEKLDDEDRAAYFMNNRFDGLETREDVRDAVYNAYTTNTAIEILEGDGDRLLTDVNPDLRKAACYAFADYVFNQGGHLLEGDTGEEPTDPSEPVDPEDPIDPDDPENPGEEPENPYYTDFSVTNSFLAPGISQSIHYAMSADDQQMVYYIATVDVTRDDVTIMANYRNSDPTKGWGTARVIDQAESLIAKHTNPEDPDNYIENFSAVVATNGDGFSIATGEPGGLLVMGGVEYHPVDKDGFFAILKDGTAMIGTQADYATYKDQIQEAIGGFGATLIIDGEIAINKSTDYYTSRASRTAIGITEDGKVVMMVLDGRQAPFSCGGSMEEIAQIMLEAGCVQAINLDGGGSTTYASKPEGSNKLTLVNRPSDGYQRNVGASLVAVSTSKMTNEFDHANITFDYDYLTIGTSVTATAVGVSGSGNAADIPEDAVWQVSDPTVGSITQEGVFTAAANGDVEVKLVQGEKVLGTSTLHVVVPDTLAFEKENMSAIFGKPYKLPLIASYNGNPVAFNENDIYAAVEYEDAGIMEGYTFTASEEAGYRILWVGAIVDANEDAICEGTLRLYKDGEAFFDFNDITGGNRELAWKRGISNSTTQDQVIYNIDDPSKPMDITYVFGLDMESIQFPEKLEEIRYMLGGEEGSSAWDYLLMFAERISVLTEVVVEAKFDEDLQIDYSNLSFNTDYFRLSSASLDEATNVLTIRCNWIDQTQAILPITANPICILSGIKATPKDGNWNDVEQMEIVNVGNISYDIYARFSSLYTFSQKPENQEKYGLYPYSVHTEEINYNGGPEQGGHFSSTYAQFEDTFTLDKSLKQGWYSSDDQLFYYVDHVPLKGIHKLPSYADPSVELFYEFGEDAVCTGTVTGVFDYNGGKCYAIMGKQRVGWVATYDSLGNAADYYFDPYTGMAVNGKCKVEGYNYEFTNYILTKGELVKDANGTRYRWAGLWQHGKWFEHEDNIYHLPRYQYYIVTGYTQVSMPDSSRAWCLFDENGVFQADYSGKYDYNGKTYLLKDGVLQVEPGLVLLDDGYYYYFCADNSAIKNRTYWPTKTNGLLPMGPYVFDAEGRITNPPATEPEQPDTPDEPDTPVVPDPPAEKKNGIYKLNGALYYYKDDVIQYCAGLVAIENEDGTVDYIYVRSNGQLAIGNYWTTTTNGLLPQGIYKFGPDGLMTNAPGSEPEQPDVPDQPEEPKPVKQGIQEENGILYYYKDGIRAYCAGLLQLEDGSYIYVRSNGQLAIGSYWITNDNGLLPQAPYVFGEDGKMVNPPVTDPEDPEEPEVPEVKNGIYELHGSLYYYENDAIKYGAGIKQLTDEAGKTFYIYVRSNGQLAIGNYWPTTTNGLLPGNRMYTFDANGRYYPA